MRQLLAILPLFVSTTALAKDPPPYSLPFQLRPAIALSVIRSDTSFASYADAAGNRGLTVATTLLGSYRVLDRQLVQLAPFVRLALVGNVPPTGATPGAVSFVNPALGGTLSLKLPAGFKLAFILGATLPVGMGGGDTPDKGEAAATRAGISARSAMDNALFAVNDFTIFPGIDFAWVRYGLTVQIEATVLQLIRVRGAAAQKDELRTNFTSGLHVGYFIIRQLSLGAELRYQHWLSTPIAVAADDGLRNTLTVAGGVRGHFKLGSRYWLRPGVSYTYGIDYPMSAAGYHIVQLDLPFAF